ncbi:hypothetical protein GCM10020256_34720 [Streptomyces thermocoprophilus]
MSQEAHDIHEPETPHLDFEGTTPYEDYVKADVLTHLQHTLSDDPGEMVFLVTTQVMELWFTVIVHEWETAARALRADDVATAIDALKRSVRELEALNASWKPLGQLTPQQFNSYRSALGEGSGFQSAMYRRMEFLLGEKSASMLVPHRGAPASTRSWRRRCTSRACTTRCCGCSRGAGTASRGTSSTVTCPGATSRRRRWRRRGPRCTRVTRPPTWPVSARR